MRRHAVTSRSRHAFTLVELLVVMGLILLLVGVFVPAVSRLIESSNYAAAINTTTATLGQARALAISTGQPTGVVFLYDVAAEQYTLQVVVYERQAQSASLSDLPSDGLLNTAAVAFRPAPNTVPETLPRRTGVFALCFTHVRGRDARGRVRWNDRIDSRPTWQWYAGEVIDGDDNDTSEHKIPWIFPRNDPRMFTRREEGATVGLDPWAQLLDPDLTPPIPDPQAIAAIRAAETFMIQFDPDGTVVTSTRIGGQDFVDAFLEFTDEPIDRLDDELEPYDAINRFDPENFAGKPKQRRVRNPEVRLRSANLLAVVDFSRLEGGVGFRRPWLFRASSSKAPPETLADQEWLWSERPNQTLPSASERDERLRAVSRWIDLNAEVIGFNRYSGNVIRRSTR